MSGEAPIRSPAPTVIVFVFAVLRLLRCVAKYSTPPAGTVLGVHAVLVEFGTQQPTWIVPGVFGSRWP